ncbi:MAG: 2-oxo acid dehydrogenase subunit E2 [Myxococcales bacterium]|nr:2-oxo acid dehydrogenase subunit E2 [Myxococcales bacterium]
MSVEVELPALGESVLEGTVAVWLVKPGDRVEVDQPLVEVTTDKVDAELPSPVAGVVETLLVAEGDTVAVGTPLLRIAEGGERAAASPSRADPAAATPVVEPASDAEPRATPLARRAAALQGVDLAAVEGSGARQRVVRADVDREAARNSEPPRPVAASTPPRTLTFQYSLQPGDRLVPLTPLRRLVAEHMVFSKQTSPHVGTVAEVDMSGVAQVRDAQKRDFERTQGFALSYLPFILHATVRALREHPRLNASMLEDAIVEKKALHVGIAVETEKGLVVPVVRDADRLSLAGLASAVEDLAARARTKKLSPDELKGGTFTVSNPGRHGNLYGFAIINQPQVAILRMGEIVKRPVVRELAGEDAIVVRSIMHLALSYDHRVVDGSPANAFLYRIRELLEEAEFDL